MVVQKVKWLVMIGIMKALRCHNGLMNISAQKLMVHCVVSNIFADMLYY